MEYLFLRRKRTTATSERQKTLLFKAAERQWKEEFAGKGTDIRKVDCNIYKGILYQLEIRQVFLDTSLSLKKLSELLETNQTYRWTNTSVVIWRNLWIRIVWNMPKNFSVPDVVRWLSCLAVVALLRKVLSTLLSAVLSGYHLCHIRLKKGGGIIRRRQTS